MEAKFAHTMIRVGSLEKSLDFYQDVMKMKLFRKKDYEAGKFTLAFLGYEEEFLELTYNWDKDSYEIGTGYGHIALIVKDIEGICDYIETKGNYVTRRPGVMKHANNPNASKIAFVKDPDGYLIELIEKHS